MRSNRSSSALLILLLLIVGGLIGYWFAQPSFHTATSQSVGTSGTLSQTQERAREEGRAVGERIAVATEKVRENVAEAALTTKIKAKMALDDSVKSRTIDVSTTGTTVTLSGTVRSAAERDRAMALARETNGVTSVIDRLTFPR